MLSLDFIVIHNDSWHILRIAIDFVDSSVKRVSLYAEHLFFQPILMNYFFPDRFDLAKRNNTQNDTLLVNLTKTVI
jgi:hypothetical protein